MSQQQRGLLGRAFVCELIIHVLMFYKDMSASRIVHFVFDIHMMMESGGSYLSMPLVEEDSYNCNISS